MFRRFKRTAPIKINDCGDYLFFWFITSRSSPASDPVVVWLQGGPGASGGIGLFQENGPYAIIPDENGGLSLAARPASWNTNANYLMIDQPAGTGLSFASNSSCEPKSELDSTAQLYEGIQKVFEELASLSVKEGNKIPSFIKNDLYYFGESFGGHYVPRLAKYTLEQNKTRMRPVLNLKGIGIGDGWVDPLTQVKALPVFAYNHSLVTAVQRDELQQMADTCSHELEKYDNSTMNGTVLVPASIGVKCNAVFDRLGDMAGENLYKISETGGIFSPSVGKYLNNPAVRRALHVSTSTPAWVDVAPRVSSNFLRGLGNTMIGIMSDLLNTSSLRIVLYGGMEDGCCSAMTTNNWLQRMVSMGLWLDGAQFLNQGYSKWYMGNMEVGEKRTFPIKPGNQPAQLTQYSIFNAGHLVPMDQPDVALQLFNSFTGNISTP